MGRCVFLTLASVPSNESPYQLTIMPKELNQSHEILSRDRMKPIANISAPTVPTNVSMSEVTQDGCLFASHIRAFRSTAFNKEVWILSASLMTGLHFNFN